MGSSPTWISPTSSTPSARKSESCAPSRERCTSHCDMHNVASAPLRFSTGLLSLSAQLPRNDWDTVTGYGHSVQTMMLMVMKQASGRPWGDHGLFLRYHIEAATLRGINSFRQYKTDATTIGR